VNRFVRAVRALLLVALAVAAAIGVLAYRAAFDRSLPVRLTTVIVPAGSTAKDVGNLLQSQGVISSALAFDLLVRATGRAADVKAGEFAFPAHQTVSDVLHEVTSVGSAVATWVTIPEGFTAKEIAQTLADRGIGSQSEFEATFLSTPLDVDGTQTPNLEGYLFPDTYLVPRDATPGQVAATMTGAFFGHLPHDAKRLAKKLGYTIPQIVTIASLVEREAKVDSERPLMAGVYYNRLRLHMPLQVDATIEYTFAHHKDTITFQDLKSDSPYNTYKHDGLPPTPIANPGLPSLEAAFHPQKSQYLYYVYMGNGHSAFARTLAQHEANVSKYLH
jgi:UPF0755 protein